MRKFNIVLGVLVICIAIMSVVFCNTMERTTGLMALGVVAVALTPLLLCMSLWLQMRHLKDTSIPRQDYPVMRVVCRNALSWNSSKR